MKLRYFFRIDHNKNPVPGSNIRRKSKPGRQWREFTPLCCVPVTIDCICDNRYFVQIDKSIGKPIDGTLIRRKSKPEQDGVAYMEIDSNHCCDLIV